MSQTPKNIAVATRTRSRKTREECFALTDSLVEDFLKELKAEGRTEKTIAQYRSDLKHFAESLGEHGLVYENSLLLWRKKLGEEGYAPQTINARTSAVNSLYNYIGRRDWQTIDYLKSSERSSPGLSREEYLELLAETRRQEKVHLYLIVKILRTTGLLPSDFECITREAVNKGVVSLKRSGGKNYVLPQKLREQLLTYAIQREIHSGSILVNSNNTVYDRVSVNRMIANLGKAAGLEPGKANPRNLHQLYLDTREEFQKQADLWIEERYNTLLNEEDEKHGWHM